MASYVYRYMHPDYPWLYVGKTNNLKERIATHDSANADNISREYEPLLKESVVLYIELANSLQSTYIEKMLIDKYKPFLNKMDKVEEESPIEFTLPKWKKYIRGCDLNKVSPDASKITKEFNDKLNSIRSQRMKAEAQIEKAQNELAQKRYELSSLYSSIDKVDLEIPKVKLNGFDNSSYTPQKGMYDIAYKEIERFYKTYPDVSISFISSGYSMFGDREGFEITKDGLLSIGHDEAERMILDSPVTQFFAASSVHFGGWFPNNKLGWVLLKKMYEDELASKNTTLEETRSDIDSLLNFIRNNFNKTSGERIWFIGYDNDGNEYKIDFSADNPNFLWRGEIHSVTFEYRLNRDIVYKYNEEDFSNGLILSESFVENMVRSLPENIVWHNQTECGNFPYLEERKKLQDTIDKIQNTIDMINNKKSSTDYSSVDVDNALKEIAYKKLQTEGIQKAHDKGVKFGRPVAQYPESWEPVYQQWKDGEITAKEAMVSLGLKRTTFYKLAKKYAESKVVA